MQHEVGTRQLILIIAANLGRDPRSVRKEHRCPGSVRGIAGEQIRRALDQHGLRAAQQSIDHSPTPSL